MQTQPSQAAAWQPPPRQDVDREAPTPRISGSFSAFRDLALTIAGQIAERRAVLAVRRTVLSTALLAELDTMSARAEELAREFSRWPQHPPDVLARCGTIQRLMSLQDQVRSYLEGER